MGLARPVELNNLFRDVLLVAPVAAGDLFVHDGPFWTNLPAGAEGQVLTAHGPGQPLTWGAGIGAGGTVSGPLTFDFGAAGLPGGDTELIFADKPAPTATKSLIQFNGALTAGSAAGTVIGGTLDPTFTGSLFDVWGGATPARRLQITHDGRIGIGGQDMFAGVGGACTLYGRGPAASGLGVVFENQHTVNGATFQLSQFGAGTQLIALGTVPAAGANTTVFSVPLTGRINVGTGMTGGLWLISPDGTAPIVFVAGGSSFAQKRWQVQGTGHFVPFGSTYNIGSGADRVATVYGVAADFTGNVTLANGSSFHPGPVAAGAPLLSLNATVTGVWGLRLTSAGSDRAFFDANGATGAVRIGSGLGYFTQIYAAGAQVASITSAGIFSLGTGTVDNSAALQIHSIQRGFLPPRMTTTQRNAIATPADGLILYNTTDGVLQGRHAGAWSNLGVIGGGGMTAHDLVGALHTVSGLTPGHVLTAATATSVAFQAPGGGGGGGVTGSALAGELAFWNGTGSIAGSPGLLFNSVNYDLSCDGNGYFLGALGVGGVAGAAAALQVDSTTRGLLPPRLTTTQRDAIATPPDGLLLYNATTGKLQGRHAGVWENLGGGVGTSGMPSFVDELVFRDDASPAHYWEIRVNSEGALLTTDLGETAP